MKNILILISFASVLIIACNENMPPNLAENKYLFSTFCDTCGNDLPVSIMDSLYGAWPPLTPGWATEYVSYSPDHSKIAGYCVFDKPGSSYQQLGVFIYDLCINRLIAFINGRNHPYWSPDGNYVSMVNGATTEIYNLKSGIITKLPAPTSAYGSGWSIDSKAIYVVSINPKDQWVDGIYRAAIDGSSFDFITNEIGSGNVFELDLQKIVIPYNDGYVIYDRSLKTRTYYELDYIKSLQSGLIHADLSPDRKRLICEVILKGGIDPGTMGIVVVDLQKQTATKIIENARYRPGFYPRWSTNKEFLCSLFCVSEYSYTTWEIDLHGNLLKKVTATSMRFY